ncbi:hypothetical protein I4U23_010884 [Adineta vaga]|nr:hypothetical protein I4U23_010884 [Adineta vaga]
MRSFLVITGHYFPSNDFELKSTVLSFSTFNTHHKAVDIRRVLEMKLKELNVLHKVIRVTCDGGKNVVRAILDLHSNVDRIWCIAHRLHLCITNGFGFWKVKKIDNGNNVPTFRQNTSITTSNNQQNGTEDIAYSDNDSDTDELVEVNPHSFINDSDNDEAEEHYDSDEEDLLSNDSNEEIEDNWTNDVVDASFDIVYEQELIIGVLKKCRALVSMVKRSTVITLFFDTERKKKNIKRNLCNDIKSRWNSTYVMIDSFIVLRELVQNLFYFKHDLKIISKQIEKLSSYELSGDDWNTLMALHYVLKPFYHATRVMSGREYPSIGLAFNLLIRTRKENLFVKKLKQLLLKQYLHYFENDHEQMELLKFHSYFDPAGYATLIDSQKRSIEHNIKRIVTDELLNASTSITEISPISLTAAIATTTGESLNEPDSTMNSKIAMDMFNDSIGEILYEGNQSNRHKKAVIIEELHNYRKHVGHFNLNHKCDAASAIKFWKIYGESIPNLKILVKRMLSTPGTSVPNIGIHNGLHCCNGINITRTIIKMWFSLENIFPNIFRNCFETTRDERRILSNLQKRSNELHKKFLFGYFCDGQEDLPYDYYNKIDTDESDCYLWPCNNPYTRCNQYSTCLNGLDELNCSGSHCSSNELFCKYNGGARPPENYCISVLNLAEEYINIDTTKYLEQYNNNNKTHSLIGNNDDVCLIPNFRRTLGLLQNVVMKNEKRLCRFRFPLIPNDVQRPFLQSLRLGYFPSVIIPKVSHQSTLIEFNEPISKDLERNDHNDWYCNRGFSILYENNETIRCLCPPSYFGSQCQWQNQRISLTIQLKYYSFIYEMHIFQVIIMLLNDQGDILPYYEQIIYVPKRDCGIKYNLYSLYPNRPKNISINYSIRIDIFNRITLTYWSKLSCSLSCGNYGKCIKYINKNSSYFCQCNSGYSGLNCQIKHNCSCSFDSFCVSSSICICSLYKFGEKCYLKHTILIFIFGFINGLFSITTFRMKQNQIIGCGIYL